MNDQEIALLDLVEGTIVDGVGFRTAIYAAGCPHHCKGCHNRHSWEIAHGTPTAIETIFDRVCADPFAHVTFTGGDPMFQPRPFTALAHRIKLETTKTIWCYTGYFYEQLLQNKDQRQLLHHLDVLVDGAFIEELKDESLLFRGSSNQRIIDVQASLQQARVVLWSRE